MLLETVVEVDEHSLRIAERQDIFHLYHQNIAHGHIGQQTYDQILTILVLSGLGIPEIINTDLKKAGGGVRFVSLRI